MKKTLLGIAYDTDEDEDLCLICTEADEKTDEDREGRLLRTPGGQFYIEWQVFQLLDRGWREPRSKEEAKKMWDGPVEKRRRLETIRPLSPREAYEWVVRTYMPTCFQEIALRGLEGTFDEAAQ